MSAVYGRLRRTRAVEREQVKWLVNACSLFAGVYAPATVRVWRKLVNQ